MVLSLPHSEPKYEGRTLSSWLRVINQPTNVDFPTDNKEARAAIITMTTNNLPLLITWLSYDTSKRHKLLNKLPSAIAANRFVNGLLDRQQPREQASWAMQCLAIAGTNAPQAIPALAALSRPPYNSSARHRALCTINCLGPGSLPTISEAMKSSNADIRVTAVASLRALGTNARPIVPDLIAALSDASLDVRANATNVLDAIAPEVLTNRPPN